MNEVHIYKNYLLISYYSNAVPVMPKFGCIFMTPLSLFIARHNLLFVLYLHTIITIRQWSKSKK